MAAKRPVWVYALMGCGALGCLCPLSVFLVGLGQAKKWAKVDTCMSRISASGRGILVYASDHDDRFPNLDSWADMTSVYRQDQDSLNCPAVKQYGYAMNGALTGLLSQVTKPATTPLLFESKVLARNAYGNPRRDSCPPRHDRRNTRLYVNGSVRFIANNYP